MSPAETKPTQFSILGGSVVTLVFIICAMLWVFSSENASEPQQVTADPVPETVTTIPNPAPRVNVTVQPPTAAPKAPPSSPTKPPASNLGAAAVLAAASLGETVVASQETAAVEANGSTTATDEFGNHWDESRQAWISPEGLLWDEKISAWEDESGNHWDEKKNAWVSSEGLIWDEKKSSWADESGNVWDEKKSTWISPEGLVWDSAKNTWIDTSGNVWDDATQSWVSSDGFMWNGSAWTDDFGNIWDDKNQKWMTADGTAYWDADKKEWISINTGPAQEQSSQKTTSTNELAQLHAQCEKVYDAKVSDSIEDFKSQIGGDTKSLTGSYGTFYSKTLADCAGIVLIQSANKRVSTYFVFDATSMKMVDFESDKGTAVYNEFVKSFEEK